MAVNFYPNGNGGTVGDDFAILPKLITPGTTWFVGNAGTDAAAPAGKRREKPLRTTAQAFTNASAGDTIQYFSNFTETISAPINVNKSGLWFIGEGTGSSRPRFTFSAGTFIFDVSVTNVVFSGLYFAGSTSTPTAKIRTSAQDTGIFNTRFECGANDVSPALLTAAGASSLYMEDCEFVSTAGSVLAQPLTAFQVGAALTGIVMSNITFDGGISGWSSSAWLASAAITNLRAKGINILNDSLITIPTGSTGKLYLNQVTGNSEVLWTP